MGSVYRARQEAVGRDVALKIVRRDRAYDRETKARFEREARAVSSLASPHTVTAFDFGEADDGSWFLVMEMLEGVTLGERLKRVRRLHWLEAARFVRHALLSLGEAHDKGIIHRDLKPDNLFITRSVGSDSREICKVLDFGIAKWLDGEAQPLDALETQAGTVFGTPRYMSPEQAQGTKLDARSDLYSLGAIFYQMLSGRAPFVDDDAVVVMARHIKDAPPPLSEVARDVEIPPSIERVLRCALEKSPADRHQSAGAFARAIESAIEEAGSLGSGVHLATVTDAPPRKRNRKALFLSLLGMGLLISAGLVIMLAPRREPRSAAPAAEPIAAEPVPESRSSRTESTSAPERSSSTAENSAPAVSDQAVSNAVRPSSPEPSSTVRQKRVPSKRQTPAGVPNLERKGNERYGRFD
jgi:serine/threonine-protein kinase